MFNLIPQQFIADNFKRWLMRTPTPTERKANMNVLKQFERASWYPAAFEQAVNDAAPGFFQFDAEGITHDAGDNAARKNAVAIMQRYLEIIDPSNGQKSTYGTRDAMEYVSQAVGKRGKQLSVWGVKKHIDQGTLAGQIIGKTRVFSREELDRFVEFYMEADLKPGVKPGSRRSKETVK